MKKGRRIGGKVTSGGYSPTLDINLGLAYVSAELAAPGTDVKITIMDRPRRAEVVRQPFYQPTKAG